MSDAATPAENNGGTPPATPAATPATPAAETVTLTKEEADQLRRDAARASANQSKADRYDRMIRNGGQSRFGKTPAQPSSTPSSEDQDELAAAEDRKAERGLLALAADPALREVLDADPTLRTLLTTNPLGVLPVLAPDALDAEDAISLVREELSKRKPAPTTPPNPNPAPSNPPAPTPATPPAGGVNPPSADVDEEYESARKLPNTEQAIAGMIRIGAKKMGGK